MKKLITAFVALGIALTLVACAANNTQSDSSPEPTTTQQPTQDNSLQNQTDYTPYADLVNEYFDTYGELVVEQNYADGERNTAGFNYAELVDLDNDGILELILSGVKDDMKIIDDAQSAIELYYNNTGDLSELVRIYTLSEDGGALLVEEMQFSSHGNGGIRYGIEYAMGAQTTYILSSFRSNSETVVYYELINGKLTQALGYESIYDLDAGTYSVTLNGKAHDSAELTDALEAYGEVVMHPISWLTEQELEQLLLQNEETFTFLEQYAPINRGGSLPEGEPHLATVDYSLYSALLKAYELDYNISNTAHNDYEVTGMTLHENENGGFYDVGGFFYANLIDFDNNGVMELVLGAVSEQETLNYTYDSPYNDLKYPNIIKIYTIDEEIGLKFLGSVPLSSLQMPVSTNLGIEYIVSKDKTYLNMSDIYQMGYGEERYLGLTDGFWGVEVSFEVPSDSNPMIDGVEYSYEEYEDIKAGFGESQAHVFTNLNDDYLEQLEGINQKTFDFLADYPVKNFEGDNAAYEDGRFYFVEYNPQFADPQTLPIYNYFKALTAKDFDALSMLYADNQHEDIGFFEYAYNGEDENIFIPGYIILDVHPITPAQVEHPDLASDLADMQSAVGADKSSVVVKAVVNEVLDPHVSWLGMQVAGGITDMYFILSTDDPDSDEWQIEDVTDNKFYW